MTAGSAGRVRCGRPCGMRGPLGALQRRRIRRLVYFHAPGFGIPADPSRCEALSPSDRHQVAGNRRQADRYWGGTPLRRLSAQLRGVPADRRFQRFHPDVPEGGRGRSDDHYSHAAGGLDRGQGVLSHARRYGEARGGDGALRQCRLQMRFPFLGRSATNTIGKTGTIRAIPCGRPAALRWRWRWRAP